jgi:hypothetical protein
MINKIILILLLIFSSATLFSQVEMNADSTFTIPYKGVLKAERIYQENNVLKAQISKYIQIEEMGDDFILFDHLLHQLELSNSLYKNLEKENYELRLDLREYKSTLEKGTAAVNQLEKDLKKEKFRRKVYSVGTLIGIVESILIYSILRNN